MLLLAKVGLSIMGTAVVGGAMLCSEGMLRVKVHEKQADGTNINLVVPAALVPMTLKFVPDRHLAHASAQLRPYLPAIDAAIPVLEDCPDGVLVEVIDPVEHVLIEKRGGSIVIDVNDADDVVYVQVPLRAAQKAIHEIAAANGAA
ncbi:MAG: hypothetical protein WB421_03495 [Terriglobales bacterium]|jgi:hypothetical protein